MLSYFLSFAAGSLTTLSPCVLPILPLVVGGAMQKNRRAPLYMATGMALAFATIGTIVSATGSFVGIPASALHLFAGIMFVMVGAIFVFPRLQATFSSLVTPLTARLDTLFGSAERQGTVGYFLTGGLLGAIWTPCSGPTLGVAIGLATQGESLARSVILFLLFGLGAAFPLLGVAYGAQTLLIRRRTNLLGFVKKGKVALGVVLLGIGLLSVSSLDKALEAALIRHLPDWWLNVTTFL